MAARRSTWSLAIMRGSNALSRVHGERWQRFLASGAIVHAGLVTADWWAALYADIVVVPSRIWLIVAWNWLIWPFGLVVARKQASRLTVGAVAIGGLLLVPSVPIIYTFTVWSIGGFSP